jgi:transposase InsO family protein
MFSLFRKEGSSQPHSPHDGSVAGQVSVSDSRKIESEVVEASGSNPARSDAQCDVGAPPTALAPEAMETQAPDSERVARAAAAEGVPTPASASVDSTHDLELDANARALDDEWDEEPRSDSQAASVEGAILSDSSWLDDLPEHLRTGKTRRLRGKRLVRPEAAEQKQRSLTPQQRLLLLDSWRRSGLPAGDFASLVGISKHTLYKWNDQFKRLGPEGLMDQPRGARPGRRLSELTKRTILMLKENHPEWGCERISDMLARGPALAASPSSVARVLHDAGYEMVQEPTRAHPDKVRRFERAKPNQLWQTDLFTFMLKRQNRRVYLVAFMDDHSRFMVSYGLHASASTALVLEALEAGISSYGPPEEVLTDNGPQYVTWRGKSQFTRRLEQHGIRQIVARPRRPQTLGKIERFWGSLWREFLETAVFVDLAEARTRIGLFIDYHNFQRVHRGIEGLVPADRFFGAATEVVRTLKERVAANALELARHGEPRAPFYVTGQLDGQSFSVHAEGPRLILTRDGQSRQEVEFTAPPATTPPPANAAAPPTPEPELAKSGLLPIPVCPDGSPGPDAPDDSFEEAGRDELPGGDA